MGAIFEYNLGLGCALISHLLNDISHLIIPREVLRVANLQTNVQRGIYSNSTCLNQKLSFFQDTLWLMTKHLMLATARPYWKIA